MRALAYLEWRYAVHQTTAILRSPGRLALWLPYALALGFLGYSRTISRHGGAQAPAVPLTSAHATALGSVYLALLCAAIALAAGGRVTAFRNGTEAIFFNNAGVRSLAIVVWLQLRKLAGGWTRMFGGVLYAFLLFAPYHTNALATLRALAATILVLALQTTVELPAFLISRGRTNMAIRALAWSAAAGAAAIAALGFFAERRLAPVLHVLRVDPGPAVRAVLEGRASALALLAVLLAVLVGSITVLGTNALPEIYAASQQTLVRSRRSRLPNARFVAVAVGRTAWIPAGAYALVWKDWIGFRRASGALRLWLFACGFWAACGAGAGYVALRWSDATPLVSLAALTAFMLFALTPLGAATGLAQDLGKPLFWLSPAPLRSRIAALTFARTWRGALALALAPLAAGFVEADVTTIVVALPLVFAIYWSLQALGIGLYSLFPNPLDARGPLVMLRSLVALGLALLPSVVAVVAVLLHFHALGACLATAATFVAEGALAVELACRRLQERGGTLATLAQVR